MPSDAALWADLREKRAAYEKQLVNWARSLGSTAEAPKPSATLLAYQEAIYAAAHLGPDPVEQAVEAYRKAVVAYEARERTGQGIYWEHLEPILAAKKALDAAILGEAAATETTEAPPAP